MAVGQAVSCPTLRKKREGWGTQSVAPIGGRHEFDRNLQSARSQSSI